MQTTKSPIDAVRDYYSAVLRSSADLKTAACCTTGDSPGFVRDILSEIDEEILDRFYGCGSPIPLAIDGCTILDLGCGTGRDVYIASKLVGESGHVIGLDMTEDQLTIAESHRFSQARRFGYAEPNVEFRHGYIEDLASAGIGDQSVDVVISNCVINLSPAKASVFEEVFRVLKQGGELLFSDVFTDRRVPFSIASDPVLYGECLGGALYFEDFRRLAADTGFVDFRVTRSAPIAITDREVQERVGNIRYVSRTIRAFKLPGRLEDRCEDYGQVAKYRGTIPLSPHAFELDDHHRFEAGRSEAVCGNTASMLSATRYRRHFEVRGDRSVHYGLFECGNPVIRDESVTGCC